MDHEKNNPKNDAPREKKSRWKLVIPFFVVLGILTLVSFIIPLRPTRSMMEKRNLAQFPTFSWQALADGTYFGDISLWFSDTFPGREQWIALSTEIDSLHGHSDIAIAGDLINTGSLSPESVPSLPAVTESTVPPEESEAETVPGEANQAADDTVPAGETIPEESQWGGVNGAADAEINGQAIIQIGDTAFNAIGFSDIDSRRYASALNNLAKATADQGIRIISAPAPTSVSVLVEPQYLEQLHCADQNEVIGYMHSMLDDSIIAVDVYSALLPHNDEYIYFRTDHHWTALGAYYAYTAICDALGFDAVPLEDCEEWDQGEFEGSLYWKAPYPSKLKHDTLYCYIPVGDMELRTRTLWGEGTVRPLIQDMTNRKISEKYSAFLFSSHYMAQVTNFDLPDGPICLVLKDSFGDCLVPFLAQNYHIVYAIDYREYADSNIRGFLKTLPVDDVIFAPYYIATQSADGSQMFTVLCS